VAATGGQRERPAPDVPAVPRQVGVGAGVEQHLENRQPAPAGDREVQAAVGVDVDVAVEEPLQACGILEVEFVVDLVLVPGRVQDVQERRVALLAGVVEGVLVALGAALDQHPRELEIAALDGVEQRGHLPLAAPLDRVAVRVGAGVQQQPRTLAHVGRRPSRPAQQHQQRRLPLTGSAAPAGSNAESAAGSASTSARSTPSSSLACT
jgi:hypothetical protein